MRTIALLFFSTTVFAQAPKTDIWMFNYKFNGKAYTIGEGLDISQNPGYDNQPAFSPGGDYILYSSDRGDGQTDIYKYVIRDKKNEAFEKSSGTSEYSPTFMNGNKYISTVMVEKDSTQRLWKFHKDSKLPSVVLPKTDSIGYHCWLGDETVFLFVLTQPFTLQMAEVRTGQTKTVADSIGRSMHTFRNETGRQILLYTVFDSKGKLWIRAANMAGIDIPDFKPIPAVEGSQDFSVDKHGNLFMAKGAKIYRWQPGKSSEWTETFDLAFAGLKNITRLTFSPQGGRMAVVENKE